MSRQQACGYREIFIKITPKSSLPNGFSRVVWSQTGADQRLKQPVQIVQPNRISESKLSLQNVIKMAHGVANKTLRVGKDAVSMGIVGSPTKAVRAIILR